MGNIKEWAKSLIEDILANESLQPRGPWWVTTNSPAWPVWLNTARSTPLA